MWEIETLMAGDDNGNYVTLVNGKLTVNVKTKSVKIFRVVELKETPPCLSVAVNDLIKLLAKENTA